MRFAWLNFSANPIMSPERRKGDRLWSFTVTISLVFCPSICLYISRPLSLSSWELAISISNWRTVGLSEEIIRGIFPIEEVLLKPNQAFYIPWFLEFDPIIIWNDFRSLVFLFSGRAVPFMTLPPDKKSLLDSVERSLLYNNNILTVE